jgi:hypothetical protein
MDFCLGADILYVILGLYKKEWSCKSPFSVIPCEKKMSRKYYKTRVLRLFSYREYTSSSNGVTLLTDVSQDDKAHCQAFSRCTVHGRAQL